MCIWVGLGDRKSSRDSARARCRLRSGKDFRFNAVQVVLGLHVASPSFTARFGLPASQQLNVRSLPQTAVK